ncbi:MAG: O-antigen ligase family protein [Candidatus Aminicenantes bacterium]|nr:O-antigen ligase family protein [Candidatus Aminicenantes bacterium]
MMKGFKSIPAVEWLHIAVLCLTAPFLLFPTIRTWWLFLLILLVWVVRYVKTGRFSSRTVLDIPILILLFQVGVTCLTIPDFSFSLPKIAGFLLGVAVYYALINACRSDEILPYAIAGFLAVGLFFSIVGILGMSKHDEPKYIKSLYHFLKKIPSIDFHFPGAEKGFHPNAVGGGLTLVLPLAAVVFFMVLKNWIRKRSFGRTGLLLLFIGIMFAISCGVFLLTQSRSSFAGIFVAICFFGVVTFRRKKALLWGVPILMMAVFVGYFFLVGSDKLPYTDLESRNKIIGRVKTFWIPAVETIKSHPVFGIGMNRARINPSVGYYQAHFHNHFLHMAAELGIPALVAYFALLFGAGYMSWFTWRNAGEEWIRLSVLGLAGGQAAFFIFGFLDTIPLGAKAGLIFWISLGLIAVLFNRTVWLKQREGSGVLSKRHNIEQGTGKGS